MAQQCHPVAIPKCALQKSSQGKLSVAKDHSLKLAIRTNLGIYCLGQDDHLGHRPELDPVSLLHGATVPR
ncbi:unnamed protein product [Caretta caretta]